MHDHPKGAGRSSYEWVDTEALFRLLNAKAGSVVLDVGCGAGNYALAMAERVGSDGLVWGVDLWQEGLDELEKRAAAHDRVIGVLIQVHIAEEETKHGFSPKELRTAIQQWSPWRWPHIQLRGLMGMATFTEDQAQVHREFAELSRLFEEIHGSFPIPPEQFDTLSMGMSGDVGIAIAEGSTMVRIGTALFGERPA